jgi:hypothetical protein
MNTICASICVAILGFLLVNKKKIIREHFMPPLSYKRDIDVKMSYTPLRESLNSLVVSTDNEIVREHFMPPLSYRRDIDVKMSYTPPRELTSTLSPRFGNVSYGANINYRPPSEQLLAVEPFNPLGVSADGEIQPVIFDRFMFAPKKSRLSEHGDPIRGDIPILPAQGDWFTVSATPHLDLRDGAMNVMGGQYNETSAELSDFKYRLTLGADNVHAGSRYYPPSDMIPVAQAATRSGNGMIPLYQEIMNRIGDVEVRTFH